MGGRDIDSDLVSHAIADDNPHPAYRTRKERVDPREVIDIRDQSIDVESIMEEIRKGLKRRSQATAEEPHFPSFQPSLMHATEAGSTDPELDYELREARALHDEIWVSSQHVPRRVPLVGAAVARLKAELHGLVVFYVNLLAARQVSFNAHSLRATERLAEMLPSRHDTSDVAALRSEVHELRERVKWLEDQIAKVATTGRALDGGDEG